MSKNYPGLWMALHRLDGAELAEADAPGYRRTPYSPCAGGVFGKAVAEWGAVVFGSIWTAPIGGDVVSWPPLQRLGTLLLLGSS
jgi:hypothetical protein